MREKDIGQRVGRKGLIIRRYEKLKGKKLLFSTLRHWDNMHFFDDCLDHVSPGGMKYYNIACVMRRIDKILELKKGRLSLTEIRRVIYNNLADEYRQKLYKEGWVE